MTTKRFLVLLFAFLLGVAAAWWRYRPPLFVDEAVTKTDEAAVAVREAIRETDARAGNIDRRIKTEVKRIYEESTLASSALSADGVADALNAELELWRLEGGRYGLDGD